MSKYIPKTKHSIPGPTRKRERQNGYRTLTRKAIEDAMMQTFYPEGEIGGSDRSLDYYTPKEISPGMWKIGPLYTNDAGKKEFDKAVIEDLKKHTL